MKKLFRVLYIGLTVAVLCGAFGAVAVACGNDEPDPGKIYTITFDTDGGTELLPISGVGGSMVVPPIDPKKAGYDFSGWYLKPDRSGEPVEIPAVMPYKNTTYYAKFTSFDADAITVTYEYNLGSYPHDSAVVADRGASGDRITVKDGVMFRPHGDEYMFVGWSDTADGVVSLSEKLPGQYNAGDEITLDGNITLYAQWARLYTDARGERDDKVYFYRPLTGKGMGAAVLVREGKPNKLGFVASGANTVSGVSEFTFYLDEQEGGEFTGRMNGDYTYMVTDGMQGMYLFYDYATEEYGAYVLAVDGFGFATVTRTVGDQIAVLYSGEYEYNERYNDYDFYYRANDETDTTEYHATFMLEKMHVEDTQFDGRYLSGGLESGQFALYGNGNIDLSCVLSLDGYGAARLTAYNTETGVAISTVEGKYLGTDRYEGYTGEWQFKATTAGGEDFDFVLTQVTLPGEEQSLSAFIMYDEELFGTYATADGKSTLYLDGYGGGTYTAINTVYDGELAVTGSNVRFVPYVKNEAGNYVAGTPMLFTINKTDMTFEVNTTGLIVESGVLTDYQGESAIVEIPNTVTVVAEAALNYSNTGVSLYSVTIPASVTSIGARAFQNNNTLRRAVFLSATPVTIDWADANDPFRWPAGDFVIVVPESAVAAYKAAWTDCKYSIKGSEEVLTVPQFEIEGNVLVHYNKPADSADVLDITIPDEVTEIADGVFLGITYIRSVNLNNVTKIGESAFENCTELVSVAFTNVTDIGIAAFAGCEKLCSSTAEDAENKVIELPAIVNIGDSAFADCFSLRRVRLGASVKRIDRQAFFECNVYYEDPPLFVELTGENIPTLGERIATGNNAFRFVVKDISVAIKCFGNSSWSSYCGHLYIESGEEKGRYVSGADILELDGRAVYQSSTVWLYEIKDTEITLYEFDEDATKRYTTVVGSINDGVIRVRIGSRERVFTKITDGTVTYKSDDGVYTLVAKPDDLQPEKYENLTGVAEVEFNGVSVEMHIIGYNTKIIYNFRDIDGQYYDMYISFSGETFSVRKSTPDKYINGVRAADGSVINIHTSGNLTYVYGKLNIAVDKTPQGDDIIMPEWSEGSVLATVDGNTYTFIKWYKNTKYSVTAVLSSDHTTFTYSYEIVS